MYSIRNGGFGVLRKQGAHCAAEQDNVVAGLDRARKRRLVAIEAADDALQQGRRAAIEESGSFAIAIEFEQAREERQDECEGDLSKMGVVSFRFACGFRRCTRAWGNARGTIQLAPKLEKGVKGRSIPSQGAARKRLLAGLASA